MGQRVGDGMDTHCRDGARDGVEDRIASEREREREREREKEKRWIIVLIFR